MSKLRHIVAVVLIVLGFGGAALSLAVPTASAQGAVISGTRLDVITIDGTISPVTADFLERGISDAEHGGAAALVVVLDTPGGLLDSTRDMVEEIMSARIPVIVYVSPPGAQAASAGTFITAAGHIAAMAPGTNIGAASPIAGSGEDLPDTLKSKATQDAAAFIRSIAQERGRNAEALEATVTGAAAYSATEAVDQRVVDVIASDIPGLRAMVDGRTVRLRSGDAVVRTSGLPVHETEKTLVESFVGFISNPNVAFLLLVLGGIGVLIEIFTPGLTGPGVFGVICLALAFVAFGNLPVNWVGIGLILLSLGLFAMELHTPGATFFGVAAVIAFVIGAFFLFGRFTPEPIETPSFRVNVWLIVGAAAAVSAFLLLVVRDMVSTLRTAPGRSQVATTKDLVGKAGLAIIDLSPRGVVRVGGEDWSAVSDSGHAIEKGSEVIVLDVDGLTLKVFKGNGVEIPADTVKPVPGEADGNH
ncbi:MAG: nodulation protein NfeD [SAR202 cluster bacterium]|nr:nodulation protein NfeD [SAR202 cluster bacterium]